MLSDLRMFEENNKTVLLQQGLQPDFPTVHEKSFFLHVLYVNAFPHGAFNKIYFL